jgi:hypothetical protein
MIERLPNTQCYHVTDTRFRAALFFTEPTIDFFARVSLPPCQATAPPQLPFDKIDIRLTASINELALAASNLTHSRHASFVSVSRRLLTYCSSICSTTSTQITISTGM